MLKMSSTRLHVAPQPLSKMQDSLVLRKIFALFSPMRLLIQKLYLASDKAFKKASSLASQTWYLQGFKFGELCGHWFFRIICRQFACRRCWATRAVCTEPHASRWICHSVRQQSVAVFNWKHKL